MDVIAHQAVRETEPPVAANSRGEHDPIADPVLVVQEDRFPIDSANGRMVDHTGCIETALARHADGSASVRHSPRSLCNKFVNRGSDPFWRPALRLTVSFELHHLMEG